MENVILKIENLNKSFGKKKILNNINLEINKGEIVAFVGPNGSGKTTTIKCILGLYRLDSGSITINGYDKDKDFEKYIEKVGCIVESPDFYMGYSGYINLKLMADLYNNVTDEDIKRCVSLVGLSKRINDKVKTYSLGMRQRLGIALALLNNPDLLILDEPTNGLDPTGIMELRNIFMSLSREGKALLISSHNLSELDNFCNKVCIINKGTIIENTNIKNSDKKHYLIKLNTIENLDKVLSIPYATKDGNYIEVYMDEETLGKLNIYLIKKGYLVYMIKENDTLESEYIKKVGRSDDKIN